MIPAEVQAIFFDAVGTLLFPDPPAATVYFEVGRRRGSRLAIAEVRDRFAAAFAREEAADLASGLRTSEERERQRWRNIVAAVLDDVADPEACFGELYEHFARPAAWRVDPDARDLLRNLQGRGYRLGMASNFDRRLRMIVRGLPALEPVTSLVISSEVGWRKPSPEFFAALCRAAGTQAQQVLLVGDDPVNDQEGAVTAGIHGLLLAGRLDELD